jgi:hypothetical protein
VFDEISVIGFVLNWISRRSFWTAFVECCGTLKHRQTVTDATQKETSIDQQQQHSCETLICQRRQTILRLLSSAATANTRWRVRELYCPTT